MYRMAYLIGGLCIGLAIGRQTAINVIESKEKAKLHLDIQENYIGIYTPYDILWLNPENNSVTSENGALDSTFTSRIELDQWMQEETNLHIRIKEEIPADSWIYVNYYGEESPIVKDLHKVIILKNGNYRNIVDTIGWISHVPGAWEFKVTML